MQLKPQAQHDRQLKPLAQHDRQLKPRQTVEWVVPIPGVGLRLHERRGVSQQSGDADGCGLANERATELRDVGCDQLHDLAERAVAVAWAHRTRETCEA